MFLLNSNLSTSHSYERVTEKLKLISYVWEEFKVCNSIRFKHFTDSFLEQNSDFIVDFFFFIKFREEIIIIVTVTNFYIKDSVSLFFVFVDWLLVQVDCSQFMQLDCSQFVCSLLNVLLSIRKKFTVFYKVRTVAKKTLNDAIKKNHSLNWIIYNNVTWA